MSQILLVDHEDLEYRILEVLDLDVWMSPRMVAEVIAKNYGQKEVGVKAIRRVRDSLNKMNLEMRVEKARGRSDRGFAATLYRHAIVRKEDEEDDI